MGFLTHLLFQSVFAWLCWTMASGSRHILAPRQSSDGCGPNPLVAIMTYAREFADFSPEQLVRFIESDNRARIQLRGLLKAYDDCVRTGEGTRYKRGSFTGENQLHSPNYPRHYEAWKLLLRNLVDGSNEVPDRVKHLDVN